MKINKLILAQFEPCAIEKSGKFILQNADIKNAQILLNPYYMPVSFGKTSKEHKSWGARINPETQEVSFKLFTYPDVTGVIACVYQDDKKEPLKIELENKGSGVFEKTNISPNLVKAGQKYDYIIYKRVKDPYSFKQEEINGPSTIYNQQSYNWQYDEIWKNSPDRISRKPNGITKSIKEARIFALNPDTFTDKRSYEGVISGLKYIKQMGFNTIEIMHIENTFSFNWGYDGVDKHAPSSYLGGPDALKHLVDEAHRVGLNVVFDIVPNHIGPDGNQLGKTGPYTAGPNDFGDAVNYEGENSEYVRDFMINACLNWVENYHVDGLRLDMTKYMKSDYALKQLAAEINYHYPECFLIAEDGRENVSVDENSRQYWHNPDEIHDKRVVRPLLPSEYGEGESEDIHCKLIKQIIEGKTNLSELGMDSEWDFPFYHRLDASLYQPNTSELLQGILCAQNSVKYVTSHDEIGNYEGTRKIAKLMVPKLMLNDYINLFNEDIERAKKYAQLKSISLDEAKQIIKLQKAQLASETLAIKYQTGELEKYKRFSNTPLSEALKQRKALNSEVLTPFKLLPGSKISYAKISQAFRKSAEQNKMALALTYSVPGPKMVFQGDESLDMTPFRFFRQFESIPNEEYLYIEKGYKQGKDALLASTMGKIKYSSEGQKRMNEYKTLTKDLNKLNEENAALATGRIDTNSIVNHSISNVIGYKCQSENNEIFTIANLGEINYSKDADNQYCIKFPKGRWKEILNTDDKKYGGSSRCLNNEIIEADGSENIPINMGEFSTVYFEKVA